MVPSGQHHRVTQGRAKPTSDGHTCQGLSSSRVSGAREAGRVLRPIPVSWAPADPCPLLGTPFLPTCLRQVCPLPQHPGPLPSATAIYLPGPEGDLLGRHPLDESGKLVPGQLAGRLAPEAVQEGGVGAGQKGDRR